MHAFFSNSVQTFQPSPCQPRPSRPRCCGVCPPTRCPASPLPTLHLLRYPLWRCCPFAWQARKTKEKIKGKRDIIIQQRKQKIAIVGSEGRASQRWVAKATELNRRTTRLKIRGSVVSFIFPHPPEDVKKKETKITNTWYKIYSHFLFIAHDR